MHRGPRRDLLAEIADAVRAEGMRFGVYYSGGLDWSITDLPPQTTFAEVQELRPNDAAYNLYAFEHVADLVRRYSPSVLWNDIEWPDAGKRGGPQSLHALFADYYAAVPEGVVNDRWGDTHHDFVTSEYEYHRHVEGAEPWENNRGIGFSFGYNAAEDESQSMDGRTIARYLADIVSRGGRLLLDVGPDRRRHDPRRPGARAGGPGPVDGRGRTGAARVQPGRRRAPPRRRTSRGCAGCARRATSSPWSTPPGPSRSWSGPPTWTWPTSGC